MPTKPSRALLQARTTIARLEGDLNERAAYCSQLGGELLQARNELSAANTNATTNGALASQLEGKVAELETANAAIGAELQQNLAAMKTLMAANTKLTQERDAANKRADEVEKNNGYLRDELNSMTIAQGRLEGSIEVYREFAPVPERDIYLDRIPRHDARVNGGFASQAEPRSYKYVGGDRRPGWYRRF